MPDGVDTPIVTAGPALGRPLGATSPGGAAVLAEPRQPSFDGSGPDRLSPHRRPSVKATLEESIRLGFTPIRRTWTPSVVSSRAPRLERPMPQGAFTPLPRSPGRSSAAGRAGDGLELPHGLAFAKPATPCLLAQSGSEGPLPALSRDGEGVPQCPRCLPSRGAPLSRQAPPGNPDKTVTGQRVDLYPQVVPILWIRGPRFVSSRKIPAL